MGSERNVLETSVRFDGVIDVAGLKIINSSTDQTALVTAYDRNSGFIICNKEYAEGNNLKGIFELLEPKKCQKLGVQEQMEGSSKAGYEVSPEAMHIAFTVREDNVIVPDMIYSPCFAKGYTDFYEMTGAPRARNKEVSNNKSL